VKYLVTYWTQTGNTKKVAEAIFDVVPGEKIMKPIDEVETLDGFDLAFIGFPVIQFGPPAAVKKFIGEHAAGKKIALFITHAMLSESEDPQKKAMLARELDKCRAACSKSELAGLFHCRGELAEKTAGELMATNFPMLMEFAAMRPLTIGHPDPEELEQARNFAAAVISP
jgi:flavodoxin